MVYGPTLSTLGFVLHPDSRQVLMVHRTARPDDEQLGKWNGLGGKLERDEDVASGMMRELREEAAIEVGAMRLRGTVNWPGFCGTDVLGFIFVIDSFTGEPPAHNVEGTLAWQPIDGLDKLAMWPGDRFFLPLVFDPTIAHFDGVLPYQGGDPVGWSAVVQSVDGRLSRVSSDGSGLAVK